MIILYIAEALKYINQSKTKIYDHNIYIYIYIYIYIKQYFVMGHH